jgi:uncharacterized protein (TIGR02231 family)
LFSLTLLSSFSLLPSSLSHAADISTVSRISKVTVYQDRALVTREAQVELPEGQNFILWEGLPSALTEESLRANGSGQSTVSILSVEIKKMFTPEETNPRVHQIMAELEKLQGELRQIQARQSALSNQRIFVDSVRNFSSTQVSKDIQTKTVPASELQSLSQFMLDSYTEFELKSLALEKELNDKNKEVQAKQQELYTLQSGSSQEKKTAILSVSTKSKTTFKAELSYVIPQASWHVSYDAKVYPSKNNCDLISYGNVQQWTSEDWKDIKLTLSSARPAIGGKMPELYPWYVDYLQAYPAAAAPQMFLAKARAVSSMNEASFDASAMGGAPMAQEMKAELATAHVSQEMGSVTYEVETAATVLSDSRSYKFPVQSENFKTELDYETSPKLSPFVFIHSKVTNDKDSTYSGGELNIFVDDNYVGQSSMNTIGRGESFDMYLGISDELKVKRTELVDKKKKTLLGIKSRKDYGYKIEVENYRKEKSRIAVYDQLPVSKNADIKVELASTSLKPSETKDLGILKWDLELEPKEKKIVEFQFSVEYPADKQISGI